MAFMYKCCMCNCMYKYYKSKFSIYGPELTKIYTYS